MCFSVQERRLNIYIGLSSVFHDIGGTYEVQSSCKASYIAYLLEILKSYQYRFACNKNSSKGNDSFFFYNFF